jgi:glutamine amidotransferase
MIAIIDYGVGNLFSLEASFKKIGAETVVTADKDIILSADKIILPGVGAFGDAITKLKESGLDLTVKKAVAEGKHLLGICLGMQLLFEYSEEFGHYEGLGIIEGGIVPLKDHIPNELKVPQMGWNALAFKRQSRLFKYINEGDFVYFVHSFYGINCSESLIATTEYGTTVTAAVERGNVFGCQFHPEKSGEVGLNILRAFIEA